MNKKMMIDFPVLRAGPGALGVVDRRTALKGLAGGALLTATGDLLPGRNLARAQARDDELTWMPAWQLW